GSRAYGALAVGVQAVADVERVLKVRRTALRPVPQVDSTVLRIRPRIPTGLQPDEEHALRLLTRSAFGRRRKQFQRTLRDAFGLSTGEISELEASTGFDLTRRPEAFTPAEFITLARALPIVPGG